MRPSSLLCITMLAPVIASAHHSFATYEMNETKSLDGTVRKLEWMNPHMWLWIDITNANGVSEPWGFEGGPISLYARAGWKPDSLQRGEKVRVEFHPLKTGEHAGSLTGVWVNGKELPMQRGPDKDSGITPNSSPSDVPGSVPKA